MSSGQFNLSLDQDLIDRIKRIFPKGDRTKEISKTLSELCDKIESQQADYKIHKMRFEKYYKPFILKSVGSKDPFYLIEDERKMQKLQEEFNASGMFPSLSDLKLCVEEILFKGEE